MNTTRQQKKEKALEIMKTMDIYKPYIKGFKDDDCLFIRKLRWILGIPRTRNRGKNKGT